VLVKALDAHSNDGAFLKDKAALKQPPGGQIYFPTVFAPDVRSLALQHCVRNLSTASASARLERASASAVGESSSF
jgi:hypothetical protein